VGPTRYVARPDGALVAYRTAGDGPVDLVFSVGISNCEVLWDHPASAAFLDRLASFSRLVVFDFRGSGASDGLSSPGFPTWEDWTQDVLAVLDEIGSERCALFAVGTAMPSAMIFAATYPERASALVLYGSSFLPREPAVIAAMEEHFGGAWGTVELCREIAPSMADDERYIEWVAKAQRLAATPRLAGALISYSEAFDARPLLGLVHAPTLVLHRPAAFVQDPHEPASRIADARVVTLDAGDNLLFGTAGSAVVLDLVEEFVTGARPARAVDRVLATVLFTDIVDSTLRAAEIGDRRWRSLLDAHDLSVREQVERFGGRLVKTTGDGVLATFDGPARGIGCAKAIRQALADIGIQVRAGLHTGEVELRGDDIGGIAVHIGARVAAQAGPGEILVSSTVKELVIGSELRFEERGVHELKGVPEEWRLFAASP
jgi:class 3 adenylate cyclase